MLGIGMAIGFGATTQSFAELNLLASALDARITFTRSSTKTYVGADGLLHTASTDECPLEYDPVTLLPVGRSFWESRTNLLLNSGSPATQSITTTAQSYTLSFTGTGTVTLSGSFSGSKTGTGSGPANRVSLTFTATAGTLTVTPSGSVQNFQLEAAATPSPYIPTTGATATRAADVAVVSSLAALMFNQSQGSLYVESVLTDTLGNKVSAALSDGTTNNRLEMRTNGPKNEIIRSAGGTVQGQPGLSSAALGIEKTAAAWDGSGTSFAIGGVLSTVVFSGAVPSVTLLSVGARQPSSGSFRNGVIRRIRYYPRRMSDAELQAITA